MGCCVGEKHSNWCEDYDIVYIDAEGKKYCIFHAPAECKFVELYDERDGDEKPALMGAKKFNGMVFERIDEVIEAGEDKERDKWDILSWNPRCNFAGTIFPYDIYFANNNYNEDTPIPSINFEHSQFKYTFFNNIYFKGKISFSNSIFSRLVSFESSIFREEVRFSEIIFKEYADFTDVRFQQLSTFANTQFRSYAEFTEVQFKGKANFIGTQFRFIANFSNNKFYKHANFVKSQFRNTTHFTSSQFFDNTSFQMAQFRDAVYFKQTKFNGAADFSFAEARKLSNFTATQCYYGYFSHTIFMGPVYFDKTVFTESNNPTYFKNAIFHDYSNFEQTQFKGGANFHLTFFKEWSYFRNAEFAKETTFAGAISKETILLESVDLVNLKLAETNIESFKFIDCRWGKNRFAPIYDEKHQEETDCNNTTLAEIYRRLKRISRESADEEQTSHWHYREKEMTRKSLACIDSTPFWNILITAIFMIPACAFFLKMHHEYFLNFAVGISLLLTSIGIGYNDFKKIRKDISKVASKLYLNTYKKISGYGEDPIRAGVILFGIVILPFIIKFIASLFPGGPSDWLKEAMWYMPLIKINLNDSQGIHYLLKGISVTLITLQAALFGFALRNKLRR